ncbi:MAG: DUF4276 family protein, partial [Candidatus Adiutrix sp.]
MVNPESLTVYVEGGAPKKSKSLQTACRQGFSAFFGKAGLKGNKPKIVACGPCQEAYKRYTMALEKSKHALLLIDSEDKIENINNPWAHLSGRTSNQLKKPDGADNE